MRNTGHLPKLRNFEPYQPDADARTEPGVEAPEEILSRSKLVTSWVCRLVAGVIMFETLFFKFTGAPESIYIFTKMNMESWWRYGQGIWELLATILLLIPRLAWAGGILTLSAMGAAIVSHLTILGISIQNDHGLLFSMAIASFVCGLIVTYIHRDRIPAYEPAMNW